MGTITDGILKQLEEAQEYPETIEGLIDESFLEEFAKLIDATGMSGDKIAERCSVSKTYINRIRNEGLKAEKKEMDPNRKTIIKICLAIEASLEETNRILKLAGKRELYPRIEEESIIIWGLKHGESGKKLELIRESLHDRGYDFLE